MGALRIVGRAAGLAREVMPGDIVVAGEAIYAGLISQTATALNIPAAALVNNLTIIASTAALAATTATLDSSQNIIAALAAAQSAQQAELLPGNTFRFEIMNRLTAALTIALGSGVQLGTLNSANGLSVSAGFTREYVATLNSVSPSVATNMTYTTASAIATFVLGINQTAVGINSRDVGNFPVPGQVITNAPAGLTAAGITVVGFVQGQGGITGLTLSSVPTAASTNTQVAFAPQITIDSIGQRAT